MINPPQGELNCALRRLFPALSAFLVHGFQTVVQQIGEDGAEIVGSDSCIIRKLGVDIHCISFFLGQLFFLVNNSVHNIHAGPDAAGQLLYRARRMAI